LGVDERKSIIHNRNIQDPRNGGMNKTAIIEINPRKNIMTWEVRITGDTYDLSELAKSIHDDDFRIYEKEGQYILESSRFDSLASPEEVTDEANRILKILTGATRLSLGGRTPIKIGSIDQLGEDGKRNIFISTSIHAYTRAIVSSEVSHEDGTIEVDNPADSVLQLLKVALQDEAVETALRQFGAGEHNWVSLYRILDLIKGDVGGLKEIRDRGWATMKSIERFKRTANSCKAVGDEARHGTEGTDPPKDPMSLSEARSFIEQILHNWLREKTRG
jgi:hypothetical protein